VSREGAASQRPAGRPPPLAKPPPRCRAALAADDQADRAPAPAPSVIVSVSASRRRSTARGRGDYWGAACMTSAIFWIPPRLREARRRGRPRTLRGMYRAHRRVEPLELPRAAVAGRRCRSSRRTRSGLAGGRRVADVISCFGQVSAIARSSSAEADALAMCLACAAASALCPALRLGGELRRALQRWPLPPRRRRLSAGRPSARAPRRHSSSAQRSRARGARRGDRDRPPDRWPRPAPDARSGGPGTRPPGRRPSARADGENRAREPPAAAPSGAAVSAICASPPSG